MALLLKAVAVGSLCYLPRRSEAPDKNIRSSSGYVFLSVSLVNVCLHMYLCIYIYICISTYA